VREAIPIIAGGVWDLPLLGRNVGVVVTHTHTPVCYGHTHTSVLWCYMVWRGWYGGGDGGTVVVRVL